MEIEALKDRRRAAQGRLASIDAALGRLHAVEREVAEREAALRTHEAEAAADLETWALDGGQGDPPSVDHDQRKKLAASLAEAKAALDTTAAAVRSLQDQRSHALRDVAAAQAEIDEACLAVALTEHAGLVDDFHRHVSEVLMPKMARLQSLHLHLYETATAHANAGREEQATRLRRLMEPLSDTLSSVLAPIDRPEPVKVMDDAPFWRNRLADLASDEPPRIATLPKLVEAA